MGKADTRSPCIIYFIFPDASIFFLIVVLCFLFAPSGEAFDCPNFVGEKYENLLRSEQYSIEKVEVHSANAEYGVIYDQAPDAGTKIKEGATIKVYVSLGQKIIKVPAWTKLKITYSDDMWGYTEYNGKKGWFNILSYESA